MEEEEEMLDLQERARRPRHKPHIEWKEPKRHGGPTLTARGVADILGYTDVEMVHQLVEKGPEKDGLPGYIPVGKAWRRKFGRGKSNTLVMFYEGDVRDWAERHPIKEQEKEPVAYTADQERIVLAEAAKIRYPDGSVNRAELARRLAYVPGTYNPALKRGEPRIEPGYGPSLWNARTYKVIKQILDDHQIGLSPAQRKNTSLRRQY